MEEIFKEFNPSFYGYKISNLGRVISPKGKLCKLAVSVRNGKAYPYVNINIRRKAFKVRKFTQLGQEVYRAFGENWQFGARVYHKDNDVFNCQIDNLFIHKGYTSKPSSEQIKIYEDNVIYCVKHYVKQRNLNSFSAVVDVDNCIGQSYFLIWKYLPQFTVGGKFYSFCAKYIRFAFLSEYKKARREREYLYQGIKIQCQEKKK